MITKTIKYTDFNGVKRTEEHNFHLSEMDIIKLNKEYGDAGLQGQFNEIIDLEKAGKTQEAGILGLETLQVIIRASYGIKSEDGRRFAKKDKDGNLYADGFMETEAYTTLLMDLAQDPGAAETFMNNIISSSLQKKVAALESENAIPMPKTSKKKK